MIAETSKSSLIFSEMGTPPVSMLAVWMVIMTIAWRAEKRPSNLEQALAAWGQQGPVTLTLASRIDPYVRVRDSFTHQMWFETSRA